MQVSLGNCKKGKVHPSTGHEDPEGEQRYSSTLSLTSALGGREWSTPRPRPLYPQERDPVPIVQKAGWALGSVWTGAENLAPIGIRSPDRPASSESLCRLSYPRAKSSMFLINYHAIYLVHVSGQLHAQAVLPQKKDPPVRSMRQGRLQSRSQAPAIEPRFLGRSTCRSVTVLFEQ